MDNKLIQWPNKFFVTGIDTDAGKSYATGWLSVKISETGESVITQKFVQTGNTEISEDIVVHRKIMRTGLLPVDKIGLTYPCMFSYPCSPDLAARLDNRSLDLGVITEATEQLSRQYQHVIIEGAGGLMVPLHEQYLTIDYVKENKLPVVLVTNGALGSINHTLLSLYAIKHEEIELLGVVYNTYFDKDKIIAEDSRNYIRGWLENHFPDAFYLEMSTLDPD